MFLGWELSFVVKGRKYSVYFSFLLHDYSEKFLLQ